MTNLQMLELILRLSQHAHAPASDHAKALDCANALAPLCKAADEPPKVEPTEPAK